MFCVLEGQFLPRFFPLPLPPNNHSHSQCKAKGIFFSLQISLWRRKVHFCKSPLSSYNGHQDHYVSSLLCARGNGMNSIGMSRDDATLWLVGSGPVKFRRVWNGVADVGQRSKKHAPYLCLLCIIPLFWTSQLMQEEERKTPQHPPCTALNSGSRTAPSCSCDCTHRHIHIKTAVQA